MKISYLRIHTSNPVITFHLIIIHIHTHIHTHKDNKKITKKSKRKKNWKSIKLLTEVFFFFTSCPSHNNVFFPNFIQKTYDKTWKKHGKKVIYYLLMIRCHWPVIQFFFYMPQHNLTYHCCTKAGNNKKNLCDIRRNHDQLDVRYHELAWTLE